MNPVHKVTKVLEGLNPSTHFFHTKIYFLLEEKEEFLPITIHSLEVEGKKEVNMLEMNLPFKDREIVKGKNYSFLYKKAVRLIKKYFDGYVVEEK